MPRRVPRQITPQRLERAALRYLDRYASSAFNLRVVLMRKVERSLRDHGGDRSVMKGWVDTLVGRLAASGIVDDTRYAKLKARSLHRRGNGTRRIRGWLLQKGVSSSVIDVAIGELASEFNHPDRQATFTYARKRRLGPWRVDSAERRARKQKDLAALARRGFSFDLARAVVEAESVEALEKWLRGDDG